MHQEDILNSIRERNSSSLTFRIDEDNIKKLRAEAQKIIELAANTGKDEVQNAIYFMKGNIDLDSFLSWFENRMKNSSIQVSHTFDRNGRIHTYVIKHDICENWSYYLKEIIAYIFNNALQKQVEVSISSSMLAFKFKEDS